MLAPSIQRICQNVCLHSFVYMFCLQFVMYAHGNTVCAPRDNDSQLGFPDCKRPSLERNVEAGRITLDIVKETFSRQTREHVQCFLNIKIQDINAGENILRALLAEKRNDSVVDVGKLCAGGAVYPVNIARRVRKDNARAVIWHPVENRYKFASEFHWRAAELFRAQAAGVSARNPLA